MLVLSAGLFLKRTRLPDSTLKGASSSTFGASFTSTFAAGFGAGLMAALVSFGAALAFAGVAFTLVTVGFGDSHPVGLAFKNALLSVCHLLKGALAFSSFNKVSLLDAAMVRI